MSTTPNANPHAKAMALRRWANKTPEQRQAHAALMTAARKKQAKRARKKKGLA